MNETTAKLVIALGIFIISFLSSAAPLRVISKNDQWFSSGNMFASGVLLASSLVHQLPGSMDNLEDVMDFPLSTFIAGLTFCMFLIMEEYLHTQFENNPFEEGSHNHGGDHGNNIELFVHDEHEHEDNDDDHDEQQQVRDREQERIEQEIQRLLTEKHKIQRQQDQEEQKEIKNRGGSSSRKRISSFRRASVTIVQSPHHHAHSHCTNATTEYGEGKQTPDETSCLITPKPKPFAPTGSSGGEGFGAGGIGVLSIRKSVRPSILGSMRNEAFEYEHPIHHHDDHLAEHMHGSLLASVILLFALSIHSIFEGMAIGVSPNMTEVISTTAAVLAHKAFAGYALGSSMVASQMKESHILVLCLVFGFCSIVGVFLGMLFQQLTDANDTVSNGVIQAMVSGTFLYVSIVEIGMKEIMMHRELSSPNSSEQSVFAMEYTKLFAFLVGYLAMSFLAIWV
jgi:zinc transporter ZupT